MHVFFLFEYILLLELYKSCFWQNFFFQLFASIHVLYFAISVWLSFELLPFPFHQSYRNLMRFSVNHASLEQWAWPKKKIHPVPKKKNRIVKSKITNLLNDKKLKYVLFLWIVMEFCYDEYIKEFNRICS